MALSISEVEQKMDFYQCLNYSVGNEDWDVEAQALKVAAGDKVVCVTASGDRPLHLLMTECAEVLSIDMNKAQNYLLELKIAALSQLDFEKYLAFLGLTPSTHRYDIFKQLKSHLSHAASAFWEHHKKMLNKGVIYQGRTERFTRLTGQFFYFTNRKKVHTLLAFDDIQEQRDYVAKNWDTPYLRKLFQFSMSPKLNFTKLFLRDPGFNIFHDPNTHPGKYIYNRMIGYLNNHLAKKSALFNLLFTGKLHETAYLPYLTHAGYMKIRSNLHRLTHQTANIVEFLNQHPSSHIDCFSLSDIASYMPQQAFDRLLYGVQHAAKPNARYCIRELMSNHLIPSELTTIFQRNHALETKLEQQETNFVYRFMVGEIQK